jgi:hypothetical protein
MGFMFQRKKRGRINRVSPHPHPLPDGGRVRGEKDWSLFMDRKKLEETIKEKAKDGKLPCAVCFKIADDFGMPKKELTKILNEMKIKISQCQLGCFE